MCRHALAVSGHDPAWRWHRLSSQRRRTAAKGRTWERAVRRCWPPRGAGGRQTVGDCRYYAEAGAAETGWLESGPATLGCLETRRPDCAGATGHGVRRAGLAAGTLWVRAGPLRVRDPAGESAAAEAPGAGALGCGCCCQQGSGWTGAASDSRPGPSRGAWGRRHRRQGRWGGRGVGHGGGCRLPGTAAGTAFWPHELDVGRTCC